MGNVLKIQLLRNSTGYFCKKQIEALDMLPYPKVKANNLTT